MLKTEVVLKSLETKKTKKPTKQKIEKYYPNTKMSKQAETNKPQHTSHKPNKKISKKNPTLNHQNPTAVKYTYLSLRNKTTKLPGHLYSNLLCLVYQTINHI